MIYKSPIKLNLFLHNVGKRVDGYHNLETIFQLIDYYDEIEINLNSSGEIKRIYGNEGIAYADDLLVQAAQILQPLNKTNFGVDIGIKKNSPTGGGVGGGSSNAATVLKVLNKLWQINLESAKLQQLGAKLGADVPIFVLGKSAFATGIGDILTPINLPQHYFLILCPNIFTSTKAIFKHKALTSSPKLAKIPTFLEALTLTNDCLAATISASGGINSEILRCMQILNTLDDKITDAKLSGTGSCVFTIFKTQDATKKALAKIKKTIDNNIKSLIAKGL
jgi:4-diphosphocytidyl-2-C-methyl-D-erythritol kinase